MEDFLTIEEKRMPRFFLRPFDLNLPFFCLLLHTRLRPHPPSSLLLPNQNSSVDLCKWDCRLPGKEGTEWAGGSFPLTLEFSADDYPAKPPKARFPAGFFHPNVYPSGTVCLSILNEDEGWRPSLTVRNVLLGVQELLADPNPKSPAQSDAYVLFVKEPAEYSRRVKAQTARYPPPS